MAVLLRPGNAGSNTVAAWVAELDGDVLRGWPKEMRLTVRKERPHPCAQLRITDALARLEALPNPG
ncbi:hypothetical protein EES39_28380 [Streptomyces sp. ADI92-24]|nr:hypothetical protein EES39_28380 [Streptomyces sp. ADI92-24]